MEITLPIGKFKAHCYQILDEAQKYRNQLTITSRGKIIAKVIPAESEDKKSILGSMAGRAEIKGDIVSSLDIKWEAEIE